MMNMKHIRAKNNEKILIGFLFILGSGCTDFPNISNYPSNYQFENKTSYSVTSVEFSDEGDRIENIEANERYDFKWTGAGSEKEIVITIDTIDTQLTFNFIDRTNTVYRLVLVEDTNQVGNFILLQFPIGEFY